jgi:GNAT superfamily N-acetyltransferase
MRDGSVGYVRYLVAEREGRVLGFGLLVFACPPAWPDAIPDDLLPSVVDLYVAEELRGQGIGKEMVRQMEAAAREAGYGQLFLSVNPVDNSGAHAWYLRAGYEPLQAQPYRERWYYTDSNGDVRRGEVWALDMVKILGMRKGEQDGWR